MYTVAKFSQLTLLFYLQKLVFDGDNERLHLGIYKIVQI